MTKIIEFKLILLMLLILKYLYNTCNKYLINIVIFIKEILKILYLKGLSDRQVDSLTGLHVDWQSGTQVDR